MIPLYDTTRTRLFPLVTLGLIALNVLVFVAEVRMAPALLRNFIFDWGLISADLLADPAGRWPTVFASMFLHGGWFHLLSNMWVLFIFGDNVEARLGRLRYLFFYLASGIAAGLLQAYVLPASAAPMIGASGAIAGVLGAYLILFPRSRIASLVPILFILTIVEIPAVIFLVFWFVTQLYSGLFRMDGAAASGIAWWAHIGGFLFGMLMVSFFARRRVAYRS